MVIKQNTNAKGGIPIRELLVREAPEPPITTQVLVIPLGYQPELNSKTLLLQTPHTLAAQYREIMLGLSRKLPSYQIAFKVPEGTMQAAEGKRHQWFYPSVNPTN